MKKIFAFILAALLAACSFTACGGAKPAPDTTVADTTVDDVAQDTTVTDEESAGDGRQEELAPGEYSVNKIGEREESSRIHSSLAGLYYLNGKTDKYGILTHDGKKDTGPVYADLKTTLNLPLFVIYDESDTEKNIYTILNKEGEIAIEGKFANYELVGLGNNDERYLIVRRYDGIATGEDDAVGEEYGGEYYSGEWFLVDGKTGKKVEGVGGTDNVGLTRCYGDLVFYKELYGEYKARCFNTTTGDEIEDPEKKTFFKDGSYTYVEDGVGCVSSSDGKVLYNYYAEDYIPYGKSVDDNAFLGYIEDEDAGIFKCAVLDEKGKVISAEFEVEKKEQFNAWGDYVSANDGLYDFEGNKLSEYKFSNWQLVKAFGKETLVVYDGKNMDTIGIYEDGKTVFEIENDGTYKVYPGSCAISKEMDGEELDAPEVFYSFKDKDFTIKGYRYNPEAVAPWLISVPVSDYYRTLVNTLTGEVVLEEYAYYSVFNKDGTRYVYAMKYDPEKKGTVIGYDIFEIK